MHKIVNVVILLCYLSTVVIGLHCCPDYCQISRIYSPQPTQEPATNSSQCLLTEWKNGQDCHTHKFKDLGVKVTEDDTFKFSLNAFLHPTEDGGSVTAFNFSIVGAHFQRMFISYREVANRNQAFCMNVTISANDSHPAPKEFYISLPFSNDIFESVSYQLNCLIIGKTYQISKQYRFYTPDHNFIGNTVSIFEYRPFVYIDVSYHPKFLLRIQSLPRTYNVTKYKIWLINNDTDCAIRTDVIVLTNKPERWYNLTEHTGAFYFKVAALHPNCSEYGCVNSTTPVIDIQEAPYHILIMIINALWIPSAILIVIVTTLYRFYRFHRFYETRKRDASCILVYLPTHSAHNNVMIELAKYLKNCNVSATDALNFTNDTTEKSPEKLCNEAFEKANIVLLATSPPFGNLVISTIHQNIYNCLLRLIKENQFEKQKKYYILQLPYCKADDVPEEMGHCKRFDLPKELHKLVQTVNNMECARRASLSEKEFLKSVRLATLEVLEEASGIVKESQETERLLTLESGELSNTRRTSLSGVEECNSTIRPSFVTDITELNLLGGKEKSNVMIDMIDTIDTIDMKRSLNNSDNTFRIEKLNL